MLLQTLNLHSGLGEVEGKGDGLSDAGSHDREYVTLPEVAPARPGVLGIHFSAPLSRPWSPKTQPKTGLVASKFVFVLVPKDRKYLLRRLNATFHCEKIIIDDYALFRT